MVMKLKNKGFYQNGYGEILSVWIHPRPSFPSYPFTCEKGFFYNEEGRIATVERIDYRQQDEYLDDFIREVPKGKEL